MRKAKARASGINSATVDVYKRQVNGYSHRKEEYTPIEDCAAGANVLMDMLYQLANEEDRASSSPQTIL